MHHSFHCKYVCLRGAVRGAGGGGADVSVRIQPHAETEMRGWKRGAVRGGNTPRVATGFHQVSQDVLQDFLIPFISFFFFNSRANIKFPF